MLAQGMADYFIQSPDFLIRLLIAGVLGGLIGLERDIHGRAAGLRTHLLVSVGAAAFTLMSISFSTLTDRYGDVSRVAAQIVTGIGFLGAGAIIKDGLTIRGLTTAASLWVVAAIGMTAGAGRLDIASATTAIALAALVSLQLFERVMRRDTYRYLTIVTSGKDYAPVVIDTLKKNNAKVILYDFDQDYDMNRTTIRLQVRLFTGEFVDDLSLTIIDSLRDAGVPLKRVSWEH